jgi:hypothetical protein
MTNSNLTRRSIIGGVAAAIGFAAESVDIADAANAKAESSSPTEAFLNFSAEATGFSRALLEATDQTGTYFNTVHEIIGSDALSEFLHSYNSDGLDKVLSNPKLGPIGRNVIKLWYTATWEQLPSQWRETYGAALKDTTFIVSPTAYTTGLLWTAIGVNPPGANGPGYGSWSDPPGN